MFLHEKPCLREKQEKEKKRRRKERDDIRLDDNLFLRSYALGCRVYISCLCISIMDGV